MQSSDPSLSEYDVVPNDGEQLEDVSPYHPAFSSSDGDVILASKDCKRMFRIHSYVLKVSSGFFRSMLSLPRSSTSKPVEVIYLNENETVLEHLLRMVSGMPLLPIDTCDLLDSVLHAAEGFEIAGVLSILRLAITTPPLADQDPIHLYGVCCRYGWDIEAKIFSTRTLTYHLHDPAHRESLERLSTSALLRLLAVHRSRREALRQRLDDPPFVSGKPAQCIQCAGMIEYHTWRELKYRIILEMDSRPLGDTIYQGLLEWPEAKACWRAGCPTPSCGRLLYDKVETLRVIKECINNLAFLS